MPIRLPVAQQKQKKAKWWQTLLAVGIPAVGATIGAIAGSLLIPGVGTAAGAKIGGSAAAGAAGLAATTAAGGVAGNFAKDVMPGVQPGIETTYSTPPRPPMAQTPTPMIQPQYPQQAQPMRQSAWAQFAGQPPQEQQRPTEYKPWWV